MQVNQSQGRHQNYTPHWLVPPYINSVVRNYYIWISKYSGPLNLVNLQSSDSLCFFIRLLQDTSFWQVMLSTCVITKWWYWVDLCMYMCVFSLHWQVFSCCRLCVSGPACAWQLNYPDRQRDSPADWSPLEPPGGSSLYWRLRRTAGKTERQTHAGGFTKNFLKCRGNTHLWIQVN